jgi:hypothetical protein
MIDPLYRYTSAPTVKQNLGVAPDTVFDAAGTKTVIRNVPTIFASSVTVFITAVGAKVTDVSLITYGGSRTITVPVSILGGLNAGSSTTIKYTGALGESYDVQVSMNGAGSVNIWTCARA